MVSKMKRVTFIELLYNFLILIICEGLLCSLCYHSIQLRKYLACSICILGLISNCFLIFKMCLFPFWQHFKPVRFIDREYISATVSKKESNAFLAGRGSDTYRIVAYYTEHNTTYIFRDEFYYGDRLFAQRIKNIIENEDLPKIDVIVEKGNMKKYKMKSCEYIVNLKYDFPEYFM